MVLVRLADEWGWSPYYFVWTPVLSGHPAPPGIRYGFTCVLPFRVEVYL
jgi:hypothetical protein